MAKLEVVEMEKKYLEVRKTIKSIRSTSYTTTKERITCTSVLSDLSEDVTLNALQEVMRKEIKKILLTLKGSNTRNLQETTKRVNYVRNRMNSKNIENANLLMYAGGLVLIRRLTITPGKNRERANVERKI